MNIVLYSLPEGTRESRDEYMLTQQSVTAILLVIAGAILVLYLLRRQKRKSQQTK